MALFSPPLLPLLILLLSLAHLSTSHFLLNTPTSLGFDGNNEDASPCGGFSITFNNAPDYHVGGEAVGVTTLHPQSNFVFRAVLGNSLAVSNITLLMPTIVQYGLGAFCEPAIAAPASWAGQQGVLQVVQQAEDGIHYQCAAVNFVSGVGSVPSSCTNASGVSAQFQDDSTLATIGGATAAATAAPSGSASGSSGSSPASTTTSGGGSAQQTGSQTAASASPSTSQKSGAESMYSWLQYSVWLAFLLSVFVATMSPEL